jgi:hypothetical protein
VVPLDAGSDGVEVKDLRARGTVLLLLARDAVEDRVLGGADITGQTFAFPDCSRGFAPASGRPPHGTGGPRH